MRRLLRMLLNALTVLSLMLLVATVVLWVRGYYAAEGWILGTERHTFHLVSARNGIYIAWFRGVQTRNANRWFRSPASDFGEMFADGWRFAGLAHVRHVYSPPSRFAEFRAWAIPHWALVVGTAPIPLWRLIRWRASRRRKREGLCATCGYDLRATPGRC